PIAGNAVTNTYNAFEEVTSYTDGNSHVTRYEYDVYGNLQCVLLPTALVGQCADAPQQYKYTYSYYSTFLLKRITDPNNHATTYQYDSYGDLCWVAVGAFSNACSSAPSGA